MTCAAGGVWCCWLCCMFCLWAWTTAMPKKGRSKQRALDKQSNFYSEQWSWQQLFLLELTGRHSGKSKCFTLLAMPSANPPMVAYTESRCREKATERPRHYFNSLCSLKRGFLQRANPACLACTAQVQCLKAIFGCDKKLNDSSPN